MKLKSLLFGLLLCLALPVCADQTWTWGAVAGAAGYKGYCAKVTKGYKLGDTPVFNLTVGTTVTVKTQLAGSLTGPTTWFCAATAYVGTNESAFSNEASVVVPVVPIGAPSGFTITLDLSRREDGQFVASVVQVQQRP